MQSSSQVGSALALNGADETRNRELRKLTAELGPVALGALSDPKTVEVMLNPDGGLWQERFGEPLQQIGALPAHQAESAVRVMASACQTCITAQNPAIEGQLPDGLIVACQIPPLVSAPVFAIRKPASAAFKLGDYVDAGSLTQRQVDALREAIRAHRNLVISGRSGIGKSTLANALLAEVANLCPDDRIVLLEQFSELQVVSSNALRLRTAGGVDLRQLFRAAERMCPERLVLGDVDGPEALDLLDAWVAAPFGGLVTVRANEPQFAMSRLQMLASMHPDAPRELAALIVRLSPAIVHLTRSQDGRVAGEVVEVRGYGQDGYQLHPL
jgi:P-type conjugative transfer ATPase TrbB